MQSFGTAADRGDLEGRVLSAPIVAGVGTPSGNGYWLAGADGAVYAFGDAGYHGSMSGKPLNGRIVALAATPSGNGYVLLGSDGGIFTFGDAQFYGSTGGMRLNAPILDLTMTSDGRGYWFVGADGGVFSFGNAAYHGSTGGMALAAPVMSITAARDAAGYWTVAADGGVFAFDVPFHGSLPAPARHPGARGRCAGLAAARAGKWSRLLRARRGRLRVLVRRRAVPRVGVGSAGRGPHAHALSGVARTTSACHADSGQPRRPRPTATRWR